MLVNVPKSLDRPVDILTLRGGWIKVFLILVGLSLLVAVFVGAAFGMGGGMLFFLAGVLGSFLFCLLRQDRVRHREIPKTRYMSSCRQDVNRRETVSRILRDAPVARPLWRKSDDSEC